MPDITKLKINETDFSVIHLNISLALHINKLKFFLNLVKSKFLSFPYLKAGSPNTSFWQLICDVFARFGTICTI